MATNLVILYESSPVISMGLTQVLKYSSVDFTLKIVATSKEFERIIKHAQPRLLIIGSSEIVRLGLPQLKKNLSSSTIMQSDVMVLRSTMLTPDILQEFDLHISIFDNKEKLIEVFDATIKEEIETFEHESKVQLTKREKEVIHYIAIGYSNKEIAETMSISAHTVISHRKNITQKLGVKSVSAITIYAVVNKLVKEDDFKNLQ